MPTSNVSNPPRGVPRILPHLIYDDVAGAVAWLTAAFGFTERRSARHTSRDGTISRTQLEVADSLFTIGEPSVHADSPSRGVSSMLYIYVDDVDAHYAHARAAGATIVTSLEDLPWGDRRYQAMDPEGHQWTFGQHIRDVELEEDHLSGDA
jgi:PhnB protein